jgi:hypothetical protein
MILQSTICNLQSLVASMPIRFRCAYCNQLLGIARRKAGTVVRCPTCAGQVVVPSIDSDETEAPGVSEEPLVFERSDFDDLLNPGTAAIPTAEKKQSAVAAQEVPVALPPTEPPAGAWGTHAEPAFDVERIRPSPLSSSAAASTAMDSIVLSRRKARLLAILAGVALMVAFGLGWLLGYLLRSGA